MRARWLTLLVMMAGAPAVRLICVALAVVIASRAASANVGAPTWGGQLAGEPAGIHDIAILREELAIDMRPLASDGPVRVAATYHLDNRAAAQALDLVLASGSGEPGELRVTLDGATVPTAPRPGAAFPASWQAPASTPLPDGTGELDYELRHPGAPLGFQLTVPPGRHALSISYDADAVRHHHGEPMLLRQFAYVLSPARSWAGFGGLEATVRLPPGWRAAVRPVLVRDGDTLHAAFPRIPADAITLTVAAPFGAYWLVRYAAAALFIVVTLAGGAAVWRVAAARQRRRSAAGEPPSLSLAMALAGSALWAGGFFAAGLLAIFGPDLVLPAAQLDRRSGYVQLFATALVSLGALIVLAVGAWLAQAAGRRAHAASSDAPGISRKA